MTSKSFKGLLSANELNVVGYGDSSQVDLLIRRSDRAITSTGIAIAPSDAPALALAILEAAGVEPVSGWIKAPLMGSPEQLAVIAQKLVLWIEASESHAKAQAELEAEALGFFNEFRVAAQLEPIDSWDEAHPLAQEQWLAVARKAREIGAQK